MQPTPKSPLHAELDRVAAAWNRVEATLSGVSVKKEGCPLSMERFGQKMRLLLNGKPLIECTTRERLAAFDHFEALLIAIDEQDTEMLVKARRVADRLEEWLDNSGNK